MEHPCNIANNQLCCKELRIVYEKFDSNLEGFVLENNGQRLIVINSNLADSKIKVKLIHEFKHLEHLKCNKSKKECEEEATDIEKNSNVYL